MKKLLSFPTNIIQINQETMRIIKVSLVVSIITSTFTYFITARQIPKFATVDLLNLNNNFITSLSQHKLENGASEEEVTNMVRNYTNKIQPLLDEISDSGNVILFQKQAIVTRSTDITPQIAEALFKDYLPNNNTNIKSH